MRSCFYMFAGFIALASSIFVSCTKNETPIPQKVSPWIIYNTDSSLSSNIVWSLAEDSAGTIWAGTQRGLVCYDKHKWTKYYLGLIAYKINESPVGLLAATDNGCWLLKDKPIDVFWTKPYIYNDILYYKGHYYHSSLEYFSFVDNKFIQIPYIANSITLIDSSDLYFNTEEGIYVISNLFITDTISIEDGLSSNYIYTTFQDSKGRIWTGTGSDKGLCELQKDTTICYDFPYVKCIAEDKEGNLWLGSVWDGVFKLETNGNRISYTMLDGLPSNRITDILVAQDNSVWVSTEDAGIARFVQ